MERIARLRRAGGSPLPEEAPLATVEPVKGALRLAALCPRAVALGLREGQALAEARAMHPALIVTDRDERAETTFLEGLADWARRWTPLVALDGPRGLILDIAGAAHLFGGEAGLLRDAAERLAAQGLTARLAIAGTAGAARALAWQGRGGVFPSGEERRLLAALPVRALGLEAAQADDLGRVGLKTIGDLVARPRAPLAARFGSEVLDRLDQALGLARAPIAPRLPAPPYSAERRFAEPIGDDATIARVTTALCAALARRLTAHAEGALRFELTLYRTDGTLLRIEARAARPLRDAVAMADLIAARIEARAEGIDARFGFDMMRLAVIEAADLGERQLGLAHAGDREEDLARLADRLGARLGLEAVRRLVPRDTHIPEDAAAAVPAAARGAPGDSAGWLAFRESEAPRPITLFATPEPVEALAEVPDGPPLRFRWRRAPHEVARAEGPERIAPEWWRAPGERRLTRDYFRVEDSEGHRFWLFREGLFGQETAAPRWFMHGLFA